MAVDTTTKLWRLRPGSMDALKAGCLCDPIDNFHGLGVSTIIADEPAKRFEASGDCPLHGLSDKKDPT